MQLKLNNQVEGFVHRPGVHCESSALRDIFEFYRFTFSESMIFGLGSGLGFIYWSSKRMPYPFVGGRARDFCKNLCGNLGVVAKVNKTSSKTRAYEALRKLIAENVPVMIHVDMPFLKYLGLPEEAHFGGHVVVVAGINENKDTVDIADTDFEKMQTATLKELEEARASKFKPFPPENKWFTFEFPPELTSPKKAIKKSISKTVEAMLEPPIKNLGTKGIKHFANEIVKWPKEYPPRKLPFQQLYDVTYIMLEEDGTGGGCFRYLYSKFLKEASEHLDFKEVADLGEQYQQVGKKWTKVAHLIRGIPSNPTNTIEIKETLLEIAKEEEQILSSLKNFL
ncbi:MAG: BtrH N-terminal domain-containing protein [Candidatus Bathyarchaeota archaeon]|nr:MAG: BtrH N-terminal domain-containing protein [Candidatus Bathyarchaeota archaeon]